MTLELWTSGKAVECYEQRLKGLPNSILEGVSDESNVDCSGLAQEISENEATISIWAKSTPQHSYILAKL